MKSKSIANFDTLMNRDIYKEKILDFLQHFQKNKATLSIHRGLYLYGKSGIGKTTFITNFLRENNYDMIYYDSSDIRNKNIVELLTNDNMSSVNVHSMFTKKRKQIVIVMDDIDCMNNGDKGGINSLIKIMRSKKTKKQKQEEISMNPIICIGNNHVDKKIKELSNICLSFELNEPNNKNIERLLSTQITDEKYEMSKLVSFIDSDLRRFWLIVDAISKQEISSETLNTMFSKHNVLDNVYNIVKGLLNTPINLEEHNNINETDRTIIALLFHENIIDVADKITVENNKTYNKVLDNICFADYIDRITFQKQIWEFNEMSSIIKTIYNNNILHDKENKQSKKKINDVRFTKVLTKYSTEYNNMVFINNMCQCLNMDKNDLIHFFLELREKYSIAEIVDMVEINGINKLDVNRLFKYISILKFGNIDELVDE